MGLKDWFRTGSRREEEEPTLRDQIRDLRSDMDSLQLDWETTYDKVRRALATMAKRQAREEALVGGEASSLGQTNGDRLTPQEQGELLRRMRRGRI